MTNHFIIKCLKKGNVLTNGSDECVREFLEGALASNLDFYPSLQEYTDEGFLEIFLHSDNYEELKEEQLELLKSWGITDDNSLAAILKHLEMELTVATPEEIVTCSLCGDSYHENDVNMNDYEEDVCKNCLPAFIRSTFHKYHGNQVNKQTDPSKNLLEKNYVGIYVFGGIIRSITNGKNLWELAKDMRAYLEKEGFDGGEDDARIFCLEDSHFDPVYVYHTSNELLFEGDVEVFYIHENKIGVVNRNAVTDDMIVFFDPSQS